MKTTTLVHRCERCRVYRRRLFICHVCDAKLCGGCSFERHNGSRVCSGVGDCHRLSIDLQLAQEVPSA